MSLTVGSLFSGVGGFDLATERVGMTVAWQSEIEPYACRVLTHRFGGVPNLGDVTKVDWSSVQPVDVLTAGFPCQPLSVAGKRAGMGDTRWLWDEVVRCIAALRPRYVVLENVPGLLSLEESVDEPLDGCVCGWVDRRRGLHLDREPQEGPVVVAGRGSRHDREGARRPQDDAAPLRRQTVLAAAGNGSMGDRLGLDGVRHGGTGLPVADRAFVAVEARTGATGVEDLGDRAGLENGPRRATHLDARGQRPLPRDLAAREGVECEGADGGDDRAPRGDADCPACGRTLDAPATLAVRRSPMGTILGDLARCGAREIGWRICDAQCWGVPQRRRRVFVVCDFAGERAAQVLFEPEGSAGDSATRNQKGQDVAYALAACAGSSRSRVGQGHNTTYAIHNGQGDPNWDVERAFALDTQVPSAIVRTLTSPRNGSGGTYRLDDHENIVPFVADLAQITSKANRSHVTPGGESRTLAAGSHMVTANTLRASDGHHGYSGGRGDGNDNLIAFDWQNGGASGREFIARKGDYAGSLGASRHDAIAGSFGVRRLTPVECERLQGFPDGWTCLSDHAQPCECPDAPRYRALGNAVAVPVVAWILGRIANAVDPLTPSSRRGHAQSPSGSSDGL